MISIKKRLTRIELMSRTLAKFLKTLPTEKTEIFHEAYAPYIEGNKLKEYLKNIKDF